MLMKLLGPDNRVSFVDPKLVCMVRGAVPTWDDPDARSVVVLSTGQEVQCVQYAGDVAARINQETFKV